MAQFFAGLLVAVPFSLALFFAGMNYEKTGCAWIATLVGCVPNGELK